jgi:thymidylate synthase ThyX
MALLEHERALIAPHVSSLDDEVFALSSLPGGATGALFAAVESDPRDPRAVLAELRARAEREPRVPVAGRALHDSLHVIALRSSLVATRVVRDSRLVEVIERHPSLVGQAHGSGAPLFTTPTGLSPELEARYRAGAERLLATYHELLPRVAELMRGRARRDGADELELARCDARAAELLRGLLPAGVTTRFGFTAGGKALRRLVRKLLSHSLGEVRALGDSIRRATAALSPRIAEGMTASELELHRATDVGKALSTIYSPPAEELRTTRVIAQPVKLLRHDKDALERVVLALAYENSEGSWHASGILDALRYATQSELEAVVVSAVARRGELEDAPRALESSTLTFELMLDFAGFGYLQRHRVLTAHTQQLGCRLGFDLPSEISELGVSEPYVEALMGAHETWYALAQAHPQEAQYVVPSAYRVRTLWTLSLRELVRVVERRSRRGEPASVRRVAQALYRATTGVHPWLRLIARADLS